MKVQKYQVMLKKRCIEVNRCCIFSEQNIFFILVMLVKRKNVSLHKLFKNKRFKNIENMMLSDRLKELRKQCDLPQRKVAAALDIDTATYCKIENGNYSPKREQVVLLANILHSKEKELLILWMADQLNEIVETNKDIAEEAIELVKIR